jgi:hypothetical protein
VKGEGEIRRVGVKSRVERVKAEGEMAISQDRETKNGTCREKKVGEEAWR